MNAFMNIFFCFVDYNRILKILVCLLVFTNLSCKRKVSSESKALEENSSEITDRVYLAVKDNQISFDEKNIDAVRFQPHDIFNQKEFERYFRIFDDDIVANQLIEEIEDDSLYVIACFNESSNSSECTPINKPNRQEQKDTYFSIVGAQTESTCQVDGKPGINLNKRFRYSDFNINYTYNTLKHFTEEGRTRQCAELYNSKLLLQDIEYFSKVANRYNMTLGQKIWTGLSFAGCFVSGVKAGAKALKAMPATMESTKLFSLREIGEALSKGSKNPKILSVALYLLTTMDRLYNKIRTWGKTTNHKLLSRYFVLKILKKIWATLKWITAEISAFAAVKMGPKFTAFFAHYFDVDWDGKRITYEEAIDILESDKLALQKGEELFFKYQGMDAYQKLYDDLEDRGITHADTGYFLTLAGSILFPPLACKIFGEDLGKIFDDKRTQGNLMALKNAIEISRSETESKLDVMGFESFKDAQKIFREFQGFYSDHEIAGKYETYDTLFGHDQKRWKKVNQYYQTLNLYTSQHFNLRQFDDKFEHWSRFWGMLKGLEREGFDDFVLGFAATKQEKDQLLYQVLTGQLLVNGVDYETNLFKEKNSKRINLNIDSDEINKIMENVTRKVDESMLRKLGE